MIFILVIPVVFVAVLLFWAGWRKSALAAILVPSAFVGAMYMAVHSNQHPDIGEGLTSVDWLPSSAKEINYIRSYSFTAYEFTITPEGFLDYAKSKDWPVAKINKKEGIARYLLFFESLGKKVDSDVYATIQDGYSYNFRQKNGGGVSVCYDLKNQRAYVAISPR